MTRKTRNQGVENVFCMALTNVRVFWAKYIYGVRRCTQDKCSRSWRLALHPTCWAPLQNYYKCKRFHAVNIANKNNNSSLIHVFNTTEYYFSLFSYFDKFCGWCQRLFLFQAIKNHYKYIAYKILKLLVANQS